MLVVYRGHPTDADAPVLPGISIYRSRRSLWRERTYRNGQFVPAIGNVAIYKLKFPAAPARPRPWDAPDIPLALEDAFHKLFPHEFYNNDGKPKALQKEKRVANFSFNTGASKEIPFKIDRAWPNGSYVMELTTVDASGDTLTDFHRFNVHDPST